VCSTQLQEQTPEGTRSCQKVDDQAVVLLVECTYGRVSKRRYSENVMTVKLFAQAWKQFEELQNSYL